MTGSSPRPRGKCSECGETRCLRGDGTIAHHRRLYGKHYRSSYACDGVGKPPAADVDEHAVDVPVVPRVEIFAIRPTGVGTRIHLFSRGYQPGKKARHPADVGMCNGTGGIRDAKLVPLADALDWAEPHSPCQECATHRPDWYWCHVCLGHALAVAGLATETAIAIAERQTAPARGAP